MKKKKVEKEGSKLAFILCLISGLISFIAGALNLYGFLSYLRIIEKAKSMEGLINLEEFLRTAPTSFFDSGYISSIWLPLIIGTLIVIYSFKMLKNSSLKVASIIILIVSIIFLVFSTGYSDLSLLIALSIIGSIIGLIKSRKIRRKK